MWVKYYGNNMSNRKWNLRYIFSISKIIKITNRIIQIAKRTGGKKP